MENETYKKKTTAPDTSVGADDGSRFTIQLRTVYPLLMKKSTVIFKTARKVWTKSIAGYSG